jgi:hypothetical protein
MSDYSVKELQAEFDRSLQIEPKRGPISPPIQRMAGELSRSRFALLMTENPTIAYDSPLLKSNFGKLKEYY